MIRQAVSRALEQARNTAPQAAVALAAALAAPLAGGAPGDFDPSFGDSGRLVLYDVGPVWSLDLEDDGGGFLAGGGDYYCWFYEVCTSAFRYPFSVSGEVALDTHPDLPNLVIHDAMRQPDGKIVAVGRAFDGGVLRLGVFRLMPTGELDTTFGDGGHVHVSNTGVGSLVLEPDGRIVVAGSRGQELLVVRLLENGAYDSTFGTDGVVVGPENTGDARLVRTDDGGYRITSVVGDPAFGSDCLVVALAADGTIDESFGTGGSVAAAPDVAGSVTCQGLAIQEDGRLLVAGSADDGTDTSAVLVRLLPDGSFDDTFAASAAVEQMTQATAIALDPAGKVFVAGQAPLGMAGAIVARLNSDGALDTTYGNAGATWIDLPSWLAQAAVVNDMAAGADGSLTVAGGFGWASAPFAARLRGDGSEDAAGAISMTSEKVAVNEGEAQAIVTVRRTGGKAGAVSVAYRTAPPDDTVAVKAWAGTDYEDVTGELSWADGDMTDRQILIPLGADGPTPEGFEGFWVSIVSAPGVALGGQTTVVEIAADGAPAGQLTLQPAQSRVREGEVLEMFVERRFYGEGRVSVTLAASGAASAGADFELVTPVVTWEDGEIGPRQVLVRTSSDGRYEGGSESLVLTLADPTGGAILGELPTTTVSITDANPVGGGGGGGSFGWASLLALCAAGLRRLGR